MGSKPVGISASRGAAVLGISEWQTQFEVWQLIMEEHQPGFNASRGYVLPEFKESASLRWGAAFEDAVVSLAESVTKDTVGAREKLFFYRDSDPNITHHQAMIDRLPQITCHIDGCYGEGVTYPNPRPAKLHEGKTTTSFSYREKWGEPGTNQIPKNYHVQTQHQMLCTGAEMNIVSVLVFPETPDHWEFLGYLVKELNGQWIITEPGTADFWSPKKWAEPLAQMGFFHQFPCPANRDLQSLLLDGYRHFWDHYILTGIEPQLTSYEDIRRAFPEPVGTLVVDAQTESWLLELAETKEEISKTGRLGKRVDELKVLILNNARKATTVPDEGSETKLIFKNAQGKKLGQYNGKTFLT